MNGWYILYCRCDNCLKEIKKQEIKSVQILTNWWNLLK